MRLTRGNRRPPEFDTKEEMRVKLDELANPSTLHLLGLKE